MFENLKQNFKFFLPYWKKGMVPVLFLLISTIISFVYPLFPKWAIDDVVMNKHYDELLFLVLLFLVLIILQRLFSYLNEISFYRFQKDCILSIQKDLLNKVFYYPMEFFDKNHSGYLMGRIRGDVAGLSYIFSSQLVMVLMNFVKFVGTFIILATLNVKLTLISACVIPLLVIKIFISQSEIKKVNEEILEENALLEKELSDTFQGVEVLKSYSKEKQGIDRTAKALSDYQEIEVRRNVIFSRYTNILDFIVHLGQVILLYFGIREVILNHLTIGAYTAFAVYIWYLYGPITNLSQVAILLDYAKRSFNRIKDLMKILPEDSGTKEILEINEIKGERINFSYSEDNEVIRDFSFLFKKKEKILIVGESGRGKSTIIKLILGLYRPESGRIMYNNIDLREINLKKLRERIGYISQNAFLFNKSIRENLAFDDSSILDKDIVTMLKKYNLYEKIKNLENCLDYEITEKGLNFSAGERQRFTVVRALLKDPDVIILDEGTSNIDIEMEEKLLKDLESKFTDKIIIHITHRKLDKKNWRIISLGESL